MEHRYWALIKFRARMRNARTVYICLLTIVHHARARKASIVFSLYTVRARTVYSTIVVLLSVRMRTVRNNNSCLNFRACARNLSPC